VPVRCDPLTDPACAAVGVVVRSVTGAVMSNLLSGVAQAVTTPRARPRSDDTPRLRSCCCTSGLSR
jgi:hypothetical protein